MKFEMFLDDCYFHMWAVRPNGDRDFNSPRLVHFATKAAAEEYKYWAERGHWAKETEEDSLSGNYICGCGEDVSYSNQDIHDKICDGGEE